ncbi:hypothetical protein EIP91_003823 [Steccherinum ochraceum]|uniref:Proteasome assembly chaperone 3 n=1 Tax=Steccherinum ochraceum TaxID=92696 RepID=A0A4R0RB99_9APHY|nr:hypothetical protein EIP91_003823 [Steccherinum ochraceum]
MLPTAQASRQINDVPTEVLIQAFADRILVLITQLGKVGNLIQATMPSTAPLDPPPPPDAEQPNQIPLPPPSAAVELSFLLGSAPTDHLRILHTLYASQAATLVWWGEAEGVGLEADRRPVIVGVALRPSSDSGRDEDLSEAERNTFHEIMGMVRELSQRK